MDITFNINGNPGGGTRGFPLGIMKELDYNFEGGGNNGLE